MSVHLPTSLSLAVVTLLLAAAPARAENEGQEDLDRATQAKLTAETIPQLSEVVDLLQSALKKGLDDDNSVFAKQLLGSARLQRGSLRAAWASRTPPSDPKFSQFRSDALEDLEAAVAADAKQPQALLLISQLHRVPGGDTRRADEALDQCISVLKEGQGEDSIAMSKQLLASALTQRGSLRAGKVFRTPHQAANFSELRSSALEDLEAAVAADPKQVQALLLIAQLQRMSGGDTRRADEALDQCIKLDIQGPEQKEIKKNALLFRAALEQEPEKKLADLNEAVRTVPEDAAVVRTRGMLYLDLGKLDEALADLGKAVELEPGYGPSYEMKAIVLTRLKQYDEALRALERARQLSPQSTAPLLQMAQIHRKQADLKAAMQDLEEARKLDPNNVEVLLRQAETEPDAEKKMADLDAALRVAPASTQALRARGLLFAEEDKLEASLADLDKAIELQPKEVDNFQAKAAVLCKFKKFDDALAALERIRQISSDSMYVLQQRARVQIQKGDLPAALAELDEAHRRDPKNPDVLALRAAVYQASGKADQAMADADEVLKLAPQSPVAIRLHAELLTGAGKLDAAIAELEKFRESDPKDTPASLQLAMLYTAKQKFAEAVKMYSDVLADEPAQWIALRGRGDALLNLGKHAEAITDYNRANELNPKDSGILNNLAWVLATSPSEKLRDGQRAVSLATEACQLTDYKAAHILSTLAAAYAETGDFATAIKWSSKAVELGKDDQQESLKKELESYQAGKPWRELLLEAKPQDIGSLSQEAKDGKQKP